MEEYLDFIRNHRNEIYAPVLGHSHDDYSIALSKDDPWLQETEWDDLFNKLKEKYIEV